MVSSPPSGFKRVFRRAMRIIIRVIIILFFLIVVLLFLLQTSFVQNFGRRKIQGFLESKLHTRVEIGGLSIDFPKKIVLKDLYFEDLHHDTLLAAGKLDLDVNLWGLFSHKIVVSQIDLEKWIININRVRPDSDFNFAFIQKAFSSAESANDTTNKNSGNWHVELGNIHLVSIHARYQDDVTGNAAEVYLSDMQTRVSKFDLNQMAFAIPDFRVNGFEASVKRYQPSQDPANFVPDIKKQNSKPVSLILQRIELGKVELKYEDEKNGTHGFFGFGNLSVLVNSIDWENSSFDISQLGLKESIGSLELAKPKNAGQSGATKGEKINKDNPRPASAAWSIRLGKIDLLNNEIKFDDNSFYPVKTGLDYHHIRIQRLNLLAERLDISDTHYRGQIRQFEFREKGGFVLRKMNTGFSWDDHALGLDNFFLQTNNSLLQSQAQVKYASFSSLTKSPGDATGNIAFKKSNIAIHDVLLLMPSLGPRLKNLRNLNIRLSGRMDGKVKDLRLMDIAIDGLHDTHIRLSGSVKGLPSALDAVYEIRMDNLQTGSSDIHALIPGNQIPDKNIYIPEKITLTGKYQGTLNIFSTDLKLNTSLGQASIDGHLNLKEKKYDARLALASFDLGKLIRQDSLFGSINLHATAKGSGFDYKTMETEAHIQMPGGAIRGHLYNNLSADLSLLHGSFKANSTIDDRNLRWKMQASGNLSGKYPAVKMDLDLDTLNLQALHFLNDTLGLKLRLNADFRSTNPDTLRGRAIISGISVNSPHQLFHTDTVSFLADHVDTVQNISLRSEALDLNWNGKYNLTEVSEAIKQTINHYYAFRGYRPVSVAPQDWKLNVLVKPSPLMLAYDSLLKGSDTARVEIYFNSRDQDLKLDLKAPSIRNGKEFLRDLNIAARTHDRALFYSVGLESAYWAGLKLYRSSILGRIADNKIQNSVILDDAKNKTRYRITTDLEKSGMGWKILLIPDSLLLNYNHWVASKDNFILYDSSGLQVNDFRLDFGNESFLMRSLEPNTSSPIDLSFENFRLRTISSFADQDNLAIGGILNGKVELRNIFEKPLFTSDVAVNDFIYSGDTVGNLNIQVRNKDANTVLAKLGLKGHGNDADMEGEYSAASGMDLNLKLSRINLNLIRAAAQDQIKDIRGNLKGNLQIKGKPAAPVLHGWLQFDSAYVIPVISGEKLKLPPDKIEFDEDGINFTNYTMVDSAGNKATLDGNVFTKDFKKYRFDLSLRAQNFRLVNAPKSTNSLFYGRLIMDADVDMLGDLESPKMNAILRFNPKTDFTVILPNNDPELVERQGVVVFVDRTHPRDTVRLENVLDSLSKYAAMKGIDVSATIETDSNAKFTLIIDERNGDALSLKGRADLTGGIDPSGKMSLTGNYELDNGAYNFSLSLLKRKFDIVRGSTVTWSGDPTDANVNIRATYLINTPPIDLMQNQISGTNTEETTRYKQKLPFIVTLIMKGELLKPIISFEISLQSDKISQWPDVDLKLQQIKTDQAEVNKQVFALLLLSRFVQENPFVSQTPTYDAQTIAMQSVSKILSDQVNQLAASLIKGVDLTVDLNSDKDYSSGAPINQTQLNVGVSKNLFSDRVRVSVGSNFQLGEVNPNQDVSNIAGDIDVDYKLTKDGRYMLRAYRRDQYQSVIEGQVVETGLSFILTFDYNAFYELFSNKKKEEKKIVHPGHKDLKDENPPK